MKDQPYVWLVHCVYSCPNRIKRGQYANICFLTEKEAHDFCRFHTNEINFLSYEKIAVGTFKKPRKSGTFADVVLDDLPADTKKKLKAPPQATCVHKPGKRDRDGKMTCKRCRLVLWDNEKKKTK